MTSLYTLTAVDNSNKTATLSIRGATLTSGNIVAEVAKAAAVRAAIEAISLLPTKSESLLAIDNSYNPALPTSAYAERGIKFLVRGVDANGNPQRFHISGGDKAGAFMDGDVLNLASTEGAALVTALEDFWLSNAGEAVTVVDVIYVD